jgi:hypothetical protein
MDDVLSDKDLHFQKKYIKPQDVLSKAKRIISRSMRFTYRDAGEGREQDAEASLCSAHPTVTGTFVK